MPLTTHSAFQVGPTWSRQLGQRLPETPFNHIYSMTSARMHKFHCILHHFTDITLHLQVATDPRWKNFCLVSYHITGILLTACCQDWRNRRFKALLSYRHCMSLGKFFSPADFISEQLQLGTKHIMTLLNTSNFCAFNPFSPTSQNVLTELVCHTLPTSPSGLLTLRWQLKGF